MPKWSLHQEPHRHYKVVGPKGKPTWNSNGQRIVSVTTVLDGDDTLREWSASQALAAGEQVSRTFMDGDAALDGSLLSFGQLAYTTGMMPRQIKEAAGDNGTLLHTYVARRLEGLTREQVEYAYSDVPYGLRQSAEEFLRVYKPYPVVDDFGPRVERAVGDEERAVAGTYDAQVTMNVASVDRPAWDERFLRPAHRIDVKQSRTIQPKHFAQLAEYEREALLNGENPSDYLTVVHMDHAGNVRLYSIEAGSAQHKRALDLFDAHLTIYRNDRSLYKDIIKPGVDFDPSA